MRIMGHQFVMGRTIDEALDALAVRRQPALPLFLRHARRSGADAPTTPSATSSAYRVRDRAHRRARGRVRRRDERAEHLGQALGAASALRARPARAGAARAGAALRRAGRARARRRHRADGRCRGVRAARAVARTARARRVATPSLAGWDGFGLAVQAYQKRAPARARLADRHWRARRGARSTCGWSRARTGTARSSARRSAASPGYPVFTRKANTDVSYLACARQLLEQARTRLPAVRDAQRAHGRGAIWQLAGTSGAVRVPAPARHGRGAVRRGHRARTARRALPRVRAGWRARGPAAVPRAAAARERRQHLVRESHRQRARAGRQHRGGPGAHGRWRCGPGTPAHSAAARSVRTERAQLAGRATSPTARVLAELAPRMRARRSRTRRGRRGPSSAAGELEGPQTPMRNPADRADVVGTVVAARRANRSTQALDIGGACPAGLGCDAGGRARRDAGDAPPICSRRTRRS